MLPFYILKIPVVLVYFCFLTLINIHKLHSIKMYFNQYYIQYFTKVKCFVLNNNLFRKVSIIRKKVNNICFGDCNLYVYSYDLYMIVLIFRLQAKNNTLRP